MRLAFLRSVLPPSAVALVRRVRDRWRCASNSFSAFAIQLLARPLIRRGPAWIDLYRKLERRELHLLPVHYYSPVPDLRQLEVDTSWRRPTDLAVIRWNHVEEQKLLGVLSRSLAELTEIKPYREVVEQAFGPGYGEVEAFILYAFLRHFRPKRMIEVGSGVSTYYASLALSRNRVEGFGCELTCIEPFPYEGLRSLNAISQHRQELVQRVPADFFQQLDAGDLLFIDSSHTVRIGSDVNYLYLEILPHLKSGVLVHIDDIHFPHLQSPDWWIFENASFWQEEVLLKALLTHNNQIETIFCSSYLHAREPNRLQQALPLYDPARHEPASIWLRRI